MVGPPFCKTMQMAAFYLHIRSEMSLLKILKEEKDARMLFIIFSLLMIFGMACLLFAIFQGHIIGGL